MPNLGGPSQSKRALLGTVVNIKMLYASLTWAVRGTKTAKNRTELTIRAYRTVSADASLVLASMLPADLLAIERARVRVRMDDQTDVAPSTVKKQERIISIAAWQARWDRFNKGRWTHQLLPDVGRWLTKLPLTLTSRLTQVLSGHGCFRSYLKRSNRADDSYCVYCVDPNDTVEHTVFVCPRWLDDRA